MKITVTVPRDTKNLNRTSVVSHRQNWAGHATGQESVGDNIRIQDQFGLDAVIAQVVAVEYQVTGDTTLTLDVI